ncbi:MAG: membrane protein insertase YidC [Spirochaetes bacterium]|nr:membrane protein insertase YidC [Spirochaetota bacterium]
MSRETRLFLFLVLWLGIVLAFIWLFPTDRRINTSQVQTNTNQVVSELTNRLVNLNVKPFEELIDTNNIKLTVRERGVKSIYFSYESREYELSSSNYVLMPFSVVLDSILFITNIFLEPILFEKNGISRVEKDGLKYVITREIIPVSNYVFDIVIKVKNEYSRPIVFNGFSLVFSGPLGPDTSDEQHTYFALRTGYVDKSSNIVETLTTSIFTGTERFAVKEEVLGVWMENRYTVVGIVTTNDRFRSEFVVRDTKYGYNKVMSLRSPSEILKEKSEKVYTFRVLVGPRKNEILHSFGYGFSGLEDGGILRPIYDFLKFLMKLLFGIAGNWGVAIILLSVVIKLLLEPLSIKAAVSMKRFQLIAPKIKEIQEKYKSDPKKMNAEIAELYKVYGANPASGCLPLLLQIPIFIALYNVLSGFIELKEQGLLWINDLTKPDTVLYIKALEGTFILPASINLLPIIMTAFSLLQTYITSSKAQTQQTVVMWILPVVFMFIFWNLPSALVLYWTIQTILSIVEQYVINKVIKY